MKMLLLSLGLLFFVQAQPQSNSRSVDSKVVSAVVYSSGAQVTSEKKINLNIGTQTLIFEDLSPNIDESSIIVNGLEHINLNSISYETDFLNEMKTSKALEELQVRLKAIEREKVYAENKRVSLEKSILLLEKNQELKSKESELNVSKIKAYKDYFASEIETLKNSIYDLSISIDNLATKRQQLALEINKLESENRVNRGKISIELDVLKSISTTLTLSYFIYDAGWFASYDLKSKGIDKDMMLSYNAKVYQSSGQNWEGITLKLSTANPISNKTKPELEPYYLDFNRQISSSRSKRSSDIANAELQEVVVTGYSSSKRSNSDNEIVEEEPTEIVEQQNSVEFVLPRSISLSSSRDPKQFKIDEHQLKTSYQYYVAPELSESVFLMAELQDWQDLELISGEANLYFENSFLGDTYLNTAQLEENLFFSLGVDEKIVLERTLPKKKTSKSLFGSTTIVDKAYEIEIKNNKRLPISILVQERLPISRNESIKIENKSFTNADYDEKKGFLDWEFKIQPGSTKTIEYSYTVKYPKNQRLYLRP